MSVNSAGFESADFKKSAKFLLTNTTLGYIRERLIYVK